MRLFPLPLLVVMFVAGDVLAEDWPQILGLNRDGHAIGEKVANWTTAPEIRWRVPCGAGYAGVAVSKGKVLLWHRVDSNEVLDCLSVNDGSRLWRASFRASYRGGVDADLGPRSVPVIEGDRVFVYGAAGDVHGVSLADGSTLWSRELRAEYEADDGYFGAGSTPIVVGNLLIVAVGGQAEAGLVAVDLVNGITRWTGVNEQAAYASPVTIQVDGKTQVIAVLGLKTVMIEPMTGTVIRQFPFGRRGPTVNAATPLVKGTQLFLTASYGIGCRMVNVAVDPPVDLWDSEDVASSQYVTPVRIGDWIYSIDGREDMGSANLVCVRWADGKIAWSRPDFGTAHLIAIDDRVLAQRTDGRIELFAADSTSFQSLATTDLPPGTYRSLPALSEGMLYCRRTISATQGELIASIIGERKSE